MQHNQKLENSFPTSQIHKHTLSIYHGSLGTEHINTQSQPHVISPHRLFIEHNQVAITQKVASAIK